MSCYPAYLRLSERPHLLIAGATGSGKSVALNGIITSLLMTRSPFRCQFVLIDPKKVELADYASLPPVARYASDHPDIVRALQWAVEETDRRFTVMQTQGAREYDGSDLYVIIDELADLMVSIKKETLPLLQRLAQIGRAARVHIIACTQNGCEMLPDPKREGRGYGFIRDGADLEKILIYKYPDADVNAVIKWWTSSACIAV